MHVHSSFASGVVEFPERADTITISEHRTSFWLGEDNERRTSYERRRKHLRRLRDEVTLPRHTNSRERIITRDHPARKMRLSECCNGGRCTWLELIFEDNEAEEAEA